MKAAVVTSFTEPLEIQDRPDPDRRSRPGPGPHRGERAVPHRHPRRARRLAGQAEPAVRAGPRGRRHHRDRRRRSRPTSHVGDRVAIPWLGHACGHCDHCVRGWETLCEEQQNTGYSVDGAFAEYAVADADYVVAVPAGVSPHDAAPLTCAGVTTYKAIKVAHIQPAERVAIFGIGGLGHLAVQYARLVGGTVIAVDVDDDKLRLATELGADHVVNAGTDRPGRRDRGARRRRRGGRPRGHPHGLRAGLRRRCAAAAGWSASASRRRRTAR